MKKFGFLLIIISVFTLGIIVFEGCKKDSFNKTEFEKNDPYADLKPLYAPIRQILSSMRGDEGDFDTRLTDHAEGMDTLLGDRAFRHYLLDSLIDLDTAYIKFTDILETYNDFKNTTYFSSSLIRDIDNDTNLCYNNNDYHPVVYISNFSEMDTSRSPIFAIGFDLELEDDSISDHIPGWYYDIWSSKQAVAIDEETGTTSEIPILILTNDLNPESLQNTPVEDETTTIITSGENYKGIMVDFPYIDYYRINYRYDNSKRSEYAFRYHKYAASQIFSGGWKKIVRRIHKNDVNSTTFYTDYGLDGAAQAFWYAFYEHDWWATHKPIIVGSYISVRELMCKMKYVDDYYQKVFFLTSSTGHETVPTKGVVDIYIDD